MANDQTQERKDFFIRYTGKDSQWAQWIAFELEAAWRDVFYADHKKLVSAGK